MQLLCCTYTIIIINVKEKTMKKKKIVKEFKEYRWGELYIEFSQKELHVLGLEKGDSVEWMQLEDGEVWKKVSKNKWCI